MLNRVCSLMCGDHWILVLPTPMHRNGQGKCLSLSGLHGGSFRAKRLGVQGEQKCLFLYLWLAYPLGEHRERKEGSLCALGSGEWGTKKELSLSNDGCLASEVGRALGL